MNHYSAIGRLTRDPELKSLSTGEQAEDQAPNVRHVCEMRLAVDGMAPGRKTGYVDVAVFGNSGKAAADVLTKGWLVAVDGRLEYRTWQTDDGQSRHGYRVVGAVEFLAAPRSAGNAEAAGPDEQQEAETA